MDGVKEEERWTEGVMEGRWMEQGRSDDGGREGVRVEGSVGGRKMDGGREK